MELHDYIADMVQKINSKYGSPNYEPIVFLERPVPLYEKIALYAISDVCVVTATRDGMNLVPYEYIVCRQAVKVLPLGVTLLPLGPPLLFRGPRSSSVHSRSTHKGLTMHSPACCYGP